MQVFINWIGFILLSPLVVCAVTDPELKKSYLEDIFIWKMSDELKLGAKEEKEFTEINKSLNKKKNELNREIQKTVTSMSEQNAEAELKKYRKLINEYNQISTVEYDSLKKLLGAKKFVQYLKVKSELTSKVKSILVGDRAVEKKEPVNALKPLPPPKIIVEPDDAQ